MSKREAATNEIVNENCETLQVNWAIEFIIKTSHLLVGVNSASNFFIYLLLRKNFRAATWRLLTCARPPENLSVSVMARSQTMRTATTRLSQVRR